MKVGRPQSVEGGKQGRCEGKTWQEEEEESAGRGRGHLGDGRAGQG